LCAGRTDPSDADSIFAVAIVVAADSVPAEAVLPIALAYTLQPPLGAVYMHYRRDVVGEGLSLREAAAELV
jgi:hypothetical protein